MAKKRIFIIEDEIKISRFIQLELEHEGYITYMEQDGRIGLEKAINGDYDLIILDVMLPSLNGMEILRRLRQTSETPVIILTAKDDITDKVMGLDIGADEFIKKYIPPENTRQGNKNTSIKPTKQNKIIDLKTVQ